MSNVTSILLAGWVIGLSACALTPTTPPQQVLETATVVRTTVAFNADASLLASGEANGQVTVWTVGTNDPPRVWSAHAGSVQGLFFLGRESLLTAGEDGTLAWWTANGELRRRQPAPAAIHDLAVEANQELVVTAHADGVVRRWRLHDLQPLGAQRLHRGGVRAVAYHASSQLHASSGKDGAIYLWRSGQAPRALAPPPTDAHDLVFSPDGATLYGAGWFRLYRWRVADGALSVVPTEHRGLIVALDLSADGRQLATISRHTDSAVQILDAATLKPITRLASHELCGTHVRFSPRERYLATTSDDATVRVWDLATGKSTTP